MATTWYERHQRSRAAVDAKQKAFARNQVEKAHLRDASWESRSQVKVSKADIKRRIAKRKEGVLNALQIRRQRLAQLLQAEHNFYTRELENSIETDEQRRARMIEQAKILQVAREDARKAEVQKIRAEQFKDGLDEFRVLKSKAIKMQCHTGRLDQTLIKEERRKKKEAEEEKIHKEYMKISQRMLEREIREARELAQKNDEMRRSVALQAAEKKAIRAAEAEEKERDVQAWLKALAEANAAEVAKNKRIHDAKTANVKEMFALNAQNIERAKKAQAILDAEEEKMLKHALELERLDKLKEEAHTAERAAEAKRFQAFLKSRLQRTEEDESALEQVLKDENDRAWAAKEAVWDANRRQKEALAAEVADGMAAQVRRHAQDALDIEAEKQRVKEEQRAIYNAAVLADEEKARKKQVEVDAYRASLRTDIALKKEIRAKDALLLVEERKEMAEASEKFDANLKAVMGSHYQPPEHYRKKKVQWYF